MIAVPWYQGLEFFLALRRLGKEVYLYNYNGQPLFESCAGAGLDGKGRAVFGPRAYGALGLGGNQ
jgi:hypothetical protein